MRARDDKTRFGYPPDSDGFRATLPAEIPWDAPISELSGLWLEITCSHCKRATSVPLKLLAAERGWSTTLRAVLPNLKCTGMATGRACGQPPARVLLVAEMYSGGRDKPRPELQLLP